MSSTTESVESDKTKIIENALVLVYPRGWNIGQKVKPAMTTKRYNLKELEEADSPADFLKTFSEVHGLAEFARAEGILGELDMKLFGRSYEKTKEFPEGRHTFVGPPGYKADLETLCEDVKSKTHEILIKAYEKNTKLFMEVVKTDGASSLKRKNVSSDTDSNKKSRIDSPKTTPTKDVTKSPIDSPGTTPSKNKTKRTKIVREEEADLIHKLKNKKDFTRNDRQEKEFAVFKKEVEEVTFDGKWSKSGMETNEAGLVCSKALSELEVKCPACGAVLRMNRLRNMFNLTDHLKKKCPISKAKKFNEECKSFDFSKCQRKPLDGVKVPEVSDDVNVDDPEAVDLSTLPASGPGEAAIGFGGESSLSFQAE